VRKQVVVLNAEPGPSEGDADDAASGLSVMSAAMEP